VDREEILSALIFNRVTNYTPVQKFLLFERFGSISEILRRRREAESVYNKPLKENGETFEYAGARTDAERELDVCEMQGIGIIPLCDESYPKYLRHIADPPIVLFSRGRVDLLGEEGLVGIVGARKASNSSINRAYGIARDLARSGLVVVSGLASGIDYYAHKGALDGGGTTIAVLGNGIDVAYPKSNRDLYERITEEGLLLSEFPLGTEPLKYNFPKRNRVISGLSRGILVVEASYKSGALITAGYALEQGREVMAVPGRAGSDSFFGNNQLIKEGAHLVEDASDVCAILGFEYCVSGGHNTLPFSSLECNILSVIGDDMVSIDDIGQSLEGSISKISSALTMLELKGAIIQYPGKNFARVEQYGSE
jgi:DNA processing protein